MWPNATNFVCLFFVCAFIDCVFGLRLTELMVPDNVIVNSTVRLECKYDLGSDEHFTIKWYKDFEEFYRYDIDHVPPQTHFFIPGVNVDVRKKKTSLF